ncbi:MAG: hypothetical protein KAS32_23765 [Candidatus Peribacteraceae bacterium]|nr:hypothetical protein [Candidatus Peribacteraceae bacterium]
MIPKYEIVNNGGDQLSSIKITDGKYKGLEYKYGEVDFRVAGVLKFIVEVVSSPNEDWDITQGELKEMAGDILYDNIKHQLEEHNNGGG